MFLQGVGLSVGPAYFTILSTTGSPTSFESVAASSPSEGSPPASVCTARSGPSARGPCNSPAGTHVTAPPELWDAGEVEPLSIGAAQIIGRDRLAARCLKRPIEGKPPGRGLSPGA